MIVAVVPQPSRCTSVIVIDTSVLFGSLRSFARLSPASGFGPGRVSLGSNCCHFQPVSSASVSVPLALPTPSRRHGAAGAFTTIVEAKAHGAAATLGRVSAGISGRVVICYLGFSFTDHQLLLLAIANAVVGLQIPVIPPKARREKKATSWTR